MHERCSGSLPAGGVEGFLEISQERAGVAFQSAAEDYVQSGFICDATAGIVFPDVNHRCEQIMPDIQLYEASIPTSDDAFADVQLSETSMTCRNLQRTCTTSINRATSDVDSDIAA